MASILPFNQIVAGSTTITKADFVFGSGSAKFSGEDSAVTAANGLIHNFRSAEMIDASAELRGDQTAIDTGHPGTGAFAPVTAQVIKLQYQPAVGAAVDIAEINGTLSIEYDFSSGKSSCAIKGSV